MDVRYWAGLVVVMLALILANEYITNWEGGISGTGRASSVISEDYADLPVMSVHAVKSTGVEVPYAELVDNIQNYLGEIVRFHGKILEITERQDNSYGLHVATGKNAAGEYEEDIIYVNYDKASLMTGDLVEVWGMVVELSTYPGIGALHIEPYAEL